MNQHLLWLLRKARCTVSSHNKSSALLNVFSSFLAKKLDLWINSFYLPAANMLEVDEIGMGLVEVKHHRGLLSPSCTSRKAIHRNLGTDLSQHSYLHMLYSEDDNENRLIDEWISNQMNSKCYYNEAVFVLGPMGAGKTTVLQEEFKKHPVYSNYAYVDTDELMEKLNGFDSKRVDEFYPKARSIAIKLTDWLLNENISFVAEGTCVKHSELEDYMQRLKMKGYVIRVRHVNSIPLEEILYRTSKRERKVHEDVVKSIYYGSVNGIRELKSKNVNNGLFEEI